MEKTRCHPKNLVLKILLGLILIFYSYEATAQSPSGISIYWGSEVGCQVYSVGDPPRGEKGSVFLEDIKDNDCIKVCENSIVTYVIIGDLGNNTINWTANGGTVIYENNNTCNVQWDNFGNGSISFDIVNSRDEILLSKTICIEKIIIPKANFTIIPFPNNNDSEELMGCVNQIINFSNQSTTNNGTDLVSYFWEFGDGTYSTEFEPNHTYTHDGNYTIILRVVNACGCSSYIKKEIYVGEKGFNISCPGVVCEGQTVTYTLPFSGELLCRDNYHWTTTGDITTVNEQTGDVTVTWNNTDESGFGYLSFLPYNCRLGCLIPTSIKIPVIQSRGTIQGSAHLCVGVQARYKLPQWPTTDFHWEILGNEHGDLAVVLPTDQRNEVIIQPLVTGTITLKAIYNNTLLNCGGMATFDITVDTFDFTGNDYLCQNSTGYYTLPSGSLTDWELMNNTNTVIDTLSNSSDYTYNFTLPGTYHLSVSGSADCPGNTKTITVVETPQAPTVSGEVTMCPDAPYTYSVVNPDPSATYIWSIINNNGTFIGSNSGSQVGIKFNNVPSAQIAVYKQKDCISATTLFTVTEKTINAEIAGDLNVCANSNTAQYSAFNPGTTILNTEGETYTWSISNTNLGSIASGQGTNHINVVWNNVTQVTTVNIVLTIKKCTLTKIINKQVTITPTPLIAITASPTTVCSGTSIQFHLISTNTVPINSGALVTWNFGGVTVTGGVNQSYSFGNIGGYVVSKDVTAVITNPNGCAGTVTNTAAKQITVLPQPPATLSISSGGNVFCPPTPITTVLTAATLTGATIAWWFIPAGTSTPIAIGQTNNTINCNAFGTYYFITTNAFGCSSTSNSVNVVSFCSTINPCTPVTNATVNNNSENNCGILNLIGSTSPTPDNQYWSIIGPGVNYSNFAGTSLNVQAGEYNTFLNATYYCTSGDPYLTNAYKKVTVPYIPDFAYTKTCNPNNSYFDIVLIDKSDFFTPVDNRSILYYIKPTSAPASAYVLTSGTTFNLTSGSYTIKLVISGNLNGVPQPPCQKEITINLATIPAQNITFSPQNLLCHDTAITFGTSIATTLSDNYLWTFEPFTVNEATNTLKSPKRVFPTPGTKTVTLKITNTYGCSRTLTLDVNTIPPLVIPPKCFNGTLVASPTSASVCNDQNVTITYMPTANECIPTNYIWMDGNTPIAGAPNATSIQVNHTGFYWLKLKSANNCQYDTPNRITPYFKPYPTVVLKGPDKMCINESFQEMAVTNASEINWTLDNMPIPSYDNNPILVLNNLAAGPHTLQVSATNAGCASVATKTIVVRPAPDVPVISQQIFCANDDPNQPYYHAILTATSNVHEFYNWSNGQNGTTINVTDGGPYKVTVNNGNCSASAQIDVPKNPQDFIWIFPTGCMSRCKTESTTPTIIGPSLPLTYWNWILNDTTLLDGHESFPLPLPVRDSGTYYLQINTGQCDLTSAPLDYRVTDCEKCRIEISQKETIKNETKFCSFDVMLSITNNSGSNINATIIAPNNDVLIIPNSFVVNSGNFGYHLTIIPIGTFTGGIVRLQMNGITKEGKPCFTEFTIDLPSCIAREGKNDSTNTTLVNKNSITIAPNPAKDEVSIQYSGLENNTTIELYDLTGRTLNSYTVAAASGAVTILTETYPAGIYIVLVKSNEHIVSQQKLIINK